MAVNSIDEGLRKATVAMANAESEILDSSISSEQWFLIRTFVTAAVQVGQWQYAKAVQEHSQSRK
jgi:hypothetical protein